MRLTELVGYLDDFLRVPEVPDYPKAHNGLQVAGGREIRRVALTVDACLATIRAAVECHADLLIVHHGLFWEDTVPLTGRFYARLQPLFASGMALYSCHLPLDVHPEVGNNAMLCRLLALTPCETFARFEGIDTGLIATARTTREALRAELDELLGTSTRVIACGPEDIRRIGVVTGSGASTASEAAARGCDSLITGEGAHHAYFLAEEAGINVFLAGHYATEAVGINALQRHLTDHLNLDCIFIEHPTGL